MQPPIEANGEEVSQAAETPASVANVPSFVTEDQEVAEWVHKQLELRHNGQLRDIEKPALHAVALDKVNTSPPALEA